MNKFFLFFTAVIAISCTNSQTKEAPLASDVVIEQKVADFIAQHPEWTTDGNTKEEITDKFQREVKKWSNEDGFLNEMPLQLTNLRDTALNGQVFKIGSFIGYNDTMRPLGSLLNYIQIRIDGIMPPEISSQVKNGEKYTLEAMLYQQGSRKDVKVINVADFRGYDLGKYTFSIIKVNPLR